MFGLPILIPVYNPPDKRIQRAIIGGSVASGLRDERRTEWAESGLGGGAGSIITPQQIAFKPIFSRQASAGLPPQAGVTDVVMTSPIGGVGG